MAMTKREAYDRLIRAATDGTFPSIEYGFCRYRCSDGRRRCVGGIFIPDKNYEPILENNTVTHSWVLKALEIPEGMTIEDIRALQLAHDAAARSGWNSEIFLRDLNAQPCFAEFQPSADTGRPGGQ